MVQPLWKSLAVSQALNRGTICFSHPASKNVLKKSENMATQTFTQQVSWYSKKVEITQMFMI